ncbi:hypothetical protein CSC3H3_19335 [Thalassospira marina]|uniref:Uncharacterized protein n=1 Tax=Thalassospira marina TaxID=2048283 RepID=A0ABM6QE58_9PROT|nr:hypothetical protein CSC3H3_19335 [Thalassospira marina]
MANFLLFDMKRIKREFPKPGSVGYCGWRKETKGLETLSQVSCPEPFKKTNEEFSATDEKILCKTEGRS